MSIVRVLPSRQEFTTQGPSSSTRRCCVRLSPIAHDSPLLPPVGVRTVSQFRCGRSPSPLKSVPWTSTAFAASAARYELVLFLTLNRNVCPFQKRQEKLWFLKKPGKRRLARSTQFSRNRILGPTPRTTPYFRRSLMETAFQRRKL